MGRKLIAFTAPVVLLVWTLFWVGANDVWQFLYAADPWWILGALALTVPQYALSAWRWAYTANALGLALSFRDAVEHYYFAGLLNSALPGGVAGEVAKVWTHGSALRQQFATGYRDAFNAVVIERTFGQIILAIATAVASFVFPVASVGAREIYVAIAVLVIAMACIMAIARMLDWHASWMSTAQRIGSDLVTAVTPLRRLCTQAIVSFTILSTYVGVAFCAAYALQVTLPTSELLLGSLLMLLSMAIPISIGGFGIREVSAAGVWGLYGADPAQGVAVAVLYGVVNLVASAPGLLYAARVRWLRNG
ncbi:MAG: flippase-like domain-containing protein [Gammaproteobacteria bacterium]|nr:flippase-like domain-containing protein [Gammaproteobacteria bacterium]